jgi:hypothetical protein
MAFTYDQVNSVATNKFFPEAIDNTYPESAAWATMEKMLGSQSTGGVNVEHFIEHSQNTQGGAYLAGDEREINYEDKLTKAVYRWASYEWPAIVRRYDFIRTHNDKDKVDLVKFETNSAAKKALKDIITDFYSANDSTSKGIVGLQKICKTSDTSAPLGGISTDDMSGWALNTAAYNTATTQMRAATIFNMITAIRNGQSRYEPDIALMPDDVHNKLVLELVGTGMLQFDTSNEKMIALGFKGIKVGKVVCYYDKFCDEVATSATVKKVFFLNSKHTFYSKNSEDNMKNSSWMELEKIRGKAGLLSHTCCLSTDQRSTFGILTAINPTL